jgi:glycosyltransferase involved in cell wall biosynthesis
MSDAVAVLVNALGPGGAERVVLTICAELLRRGRNVELLCLEREVAYELPPGLKVEFLSEAQRGSGPAKLLALPSLARRLARLSRKRGYRAVQSHLFRANYVNVLSRSFGARHRAQIVNHTKPARLLAEGLGGRANAFLTRRLYPRADSIVAISRRMAADLAAFVGVDEASVLTINNPYEIERVRELAADGTGLSPLPRAGRRTIAAMGRLVPLKRFVELLAAFAVARAGRPDLDLVVLGEGSEREELEARASALGLEDCAFFPGFAANPYRLLAGSAVFALSSETEGFPNALIESLALALPIVSTDCVSGPREILAPGSDWRRVLAPGEGPERAAYGLLVPVGDVDAMAAALGAVLDEPALASRLAAAGPGRARDFDAAKIVDRYEEWLFPGEKGA